MDIMRPLPAHTIRSVRQLADGHPVYLFVLDAGAFVLKAEQANLNATVSGSLDIMNAVDQHARSRALSKQELMRMRDWVQRNAADVEEQNDGHLLTLIKDALTPPLPPGVQPAPGWAPRRSTIIVMEAKRDLIDLEGAGQKALAGDKTDVRAMAATLREPGGLEKLGEIIAVDAFTGYQDRVNFNGYGVKWQGTRLKKIWNIGNFFIGAGTAGPVVLGLDAYDPNSQFKGIGGWSDDEWYPGQLLHHARAADRLALAQEIVDDIETVLGPRNRKVAWGKKTRLPSDAARRLVKGMEVGADRILHHIKARYPNGGMPVGLHRKLDACGWLTPAVFPRI